LNRANNGQILSAWLPWIDFVRRERELEEREENLKFMNEKEQEEEKKRLKVLDEQRAMGAAFDEEREQREREMEEERDRLYNEMDEIRKQEAERKQQVGLKMIQKVSSCEPSQQTHHHTSQHITTQHNTSQY